MNKGMGMVMLVRLRSYRGTSACCYRCSVPGLAGFAAARLHGVRSLSKKSQNMAWRRGWDSNPRYSFPYTAFPVLPVKPLLHLSLLWRRGWDSNPRYPCGYNGFRDRPIQPLSHLSALELALRLSRKKDCIIARQSSSSTPPLITIL